MNENIEMLNYIYQNVSMGISGINDLIPKVEEKKFLKLLKNEKKEYDSISCKVENMISEKNREAKDISPMAKIGSNIMLDFKIMQDNSISNMAKMMIEGTNKGIIEITEKINSYEDIEKEIMDIAILLKQTLEKNVNDLKDFL